MNDIVEKQLPQFIQGRWLQKIYTYSKEGGYPLSEDLVELSEDEALTLLQNFKLKNRLVEVNLPSFILSLPFNLQDELAAYTQNNKLLEVIFNSGKISKEDIAKLKERILYDYSEQAFSEELKNAMIAALDSLNN